MVTRRELLRLFTHMLGAVNLTNFPAHLGINQSPNQGLLGRVTTDAIRSYTEPSYKSEPIRWYRRDTLLNIHKEVSSRHPMYHNRRWYKIENGYIHSMYVQKIDNPYYNQVSQSIPPEGVLGLVTVPFTQTYQKLSGDRFSKLYRLYYQSTHWITGLESGPDGKPWYRLTDELLKIKYFVPASHIQLVNPENLAPISPHLSSTDKVIRISLSQQTLRAFEFERLVYSARISSGIPSDGPTENGIPTDTPQGKYYVTLKMPSKHMGDGEITSDLSAYELLGVPWNCFFTATGVALHGTYWHDNFGSRMSHGCVNLKNQDALWLYRWTDPVIEPGEWYQMGRGTLVIVE